jgi:hypothetical protein
VESKEEKNMKIKGLSRTVQKEMEKKEGDKKELKRGNYDQRTLLETS